MIEEVRKQIKKEQMIAAEDVVLAGVSGGADSVCLLLVLNELRQALGFSLMAVHVEHGIRGEESLADAAFTEQLCRRLGVQCRVYHVGVPAYAAAHRLGIEEAARELRYDCYRKAAEEAGEEGRPVRIALAHHADDNAETVLFQMVRGSGLDGLCGMQPVRMLGGGMTMIRPLLGQSRAQIEQYLQEQGQEFCTDATNTDVEYSRNRIRHRVLPELTQINQQAVAHINQSAGLLREVQAYLEAQTRELVQEACTRDEDCVRMNAEVLLAAPEFLRREAVHAMLCEVAGSSRDITAVHVEEVAELLEKQSGRQISLPYGMVAQKCYQELLLGRCDRRKATDADFFIEWQEAELTALLDGKTRTLAVPGGELRFRVFDFCGEMQEILKKRYTKWLDYDKIRNRLQIRYRREGDYLTVSDEGHHKRLKEYFINEKIPAAQRDAVLLLTQDAHVVWVTGGRISSVYKVQRDTKRILEVQISGGNDDED